MLTFSPWRASSVAATSPLCPAPNTRTSGLLLVERAARNIERQTPCSGRARMRQRIIRSVHGREIALEVATSKQLLAKLHSRSTPDSTVRLRTSAYALACVRLHNAGVRNRQSLNSDLAYSALMSNGQSKVHTLIWTDVVNTST